MRTVGFLRWAETEQQKASWRHGPAFVRRLLVDRGSQTDGAPIASDRVAQLTDAQVEEIARAALLVVRPWLDRRRRDTADATQARAAATGDASEDLRSVVDAYVGWQQETLRDSARRMQDALGFAKLGAFNHVVERTNAVSATARLGEEYRKMTAPRLTILDSLTKAHRSMISQATSPLLSVRGIGPNIASEHFASLFAATKTVDALMPSIGWARDLHKGLGVGISKSMLEAIGGSRSLASLALPESHALLRMTKPGFGMLSAIGLGGLGPRGAIADLLATYEQSDRAPIFGAVGGAVETLDLPDEARLDRLLERIEQVLHQVSTALDRLPKSDGLSREALIALIGLLVAIASTAIAYDALEVARQGPTAAQFDRLNQEVEAIRADAHQAAPDPASRYLDSTAPLRAEPQANGLLLRIVYPDQRLMVRRTDGAWAFVEVYDYRSDQSITGWISRKRLRLSPR